MIVKICGLTNLEDSLLALDAGADMLGFNFYPPSPRYISPLVCSQIITGLEERGMRTTAVGVFVNASAEMVQAVLQECWLELAQLSGDESPETLHTLGDCAFKALRPDSAQAFAEALRRYPARLQPPAWLVDAYRPGEYGGTGRIADWSLAASLAAQAPLLLAGGLAPENAAAAIRQVQPWGLDVASGVEASPGRKDARKMAAFIQAARQAEQEMMM